MFLTISLYVLYMAYESDQSTTLISKQLRRLTSNPFDFSVSALVHQAFWDEALHLKSLIDSISKSSIRQEMN